MDDWQTECFRSFCAALGYEEAYFERLDQHSWKSTYSGSVFTVRFRGGE